MVMTATATDLHPCECGCGELVRNRFKRGHSRRKGPDGTRLDMTPPRLLPPADVTDDELDEAIDGHLGLAPEPAPVPEAVEPAEQDEPEYSPDPEPGHLRPPKGGRQRPASDKPRGTRITATIRKDVQAKIGFVLTPAGYAWSARDPYCGGTFVRQVPEISDALADIVCDSPDLLAWFTGPAGGFMKYFKLVMALAPVAVAVQGHHLSEEARQARAAGQQVPAFQPPDYSQYAA